MRQDPLVVLNHIAQILYDKKGFNILALDVRGVSTLTDFFIIAEGSADKHVTALANAVSETLKKEGELPTHIESVKEGDWVVIDYLEIVIHIFKSGLRDRYRLEELWKEGKIIDLKLTSNV